MKLQPHTLAQKCPLVCDCLGSLWIGLVAVTVTFRNSDKTLALEVQNADCEVFVLVKFWFCRAIDFLFGFCDFLVHSWCCLSANIIPELSCAQNSHLVLCRFRLRHGNYRMF